MWFYAPSIFLFSLLLSPLCEAKENSQAENSFHAISSLRFFLTQDNEDSADFIASDNSELDELWRRALDCCNFEDELKVANETYYQWLYENDETLCRIQLSEVKIILDRVWESVRKQLEEDQTFEEANILGRKYPNFDDNPNITSSMRKAIKPYLLPQKAPVKSLLDAIFCNSRATQDVQSFADAGFITLHAQETSFVRVATHPTITNYLFKAYLDTGTRSRGGKQGWVWLVQRCEGAKKIRDLIKKKKIRHFTVPDKWLYPLPYTPFAVLPAGDAPQPVVLLVTDKHLTSTEKCEQAWKQVTTRHLDELYCILSYGYGSTSLIYNIPYCQDGTFAFIDTEYPHREHTLSKVKRFLSEEMQIYWDKLVKQGGKL